MQYLVPAVVSFLVGVVLVPLVIRIARQKKWFDRVEKRKIHTGEIPRLGGVALFAAILVGSVAGLAVLGAHDSTAVARYGLVDSLLLVTGLAGMFAVGLVDDFRNIPAAIKFLGQLAAASIISLGGFRISALVIPLVAAPVDLGALSFPLTVLWIVGMANAMNLIDGMDGFAGGVALFASVTFAAIGFIQGNDAVVVVSLAVLAASVTFLCFNLPPARIFMGDSGSLLLGSMLAVLPLLDGKAQATSSQLAVAVSGTVLLIPILDTISAIIRRTRRGQPFYKPDCEHLHHKLLDLFKSSTNVLYVLYAYQVALGIVAVSYQYVDPTVSASLCFSVWVLSFIFIAATKTRHLRLIRSYGLGETRHEHPVDSSVAKHTTNVV